MRSKDFSEKEAKARKQGFQAKIWMQKSGVASFFQINFKYNPSSLKRKKNKQVKINEKLKRKKKAQEKRNKKTAHSTSIPKRNFRWVTPLKSKDFSEIVAKGRKQGFQAKIWMQKSDGLRFFQNKSKIKRK